MIIAFRFRQLADIYFFALHRDGKHSVTHSYEVHNERVGGHAYGYVPELMVAIRSEFPSADFGASRRSNHDALYLNEIDRAKLELMVEWR